MVIKTLNKILLFTSLALGFSYSVMAAGVKSDSLPVVSDLKVKLSGFGQFQVGYLNQDHLAAGREKNVSANRSSIAFFSDAALVADVSNMLDELTYGGKIVLVPTAYRKGGMDYNGSHIYMQSEFGRVEAGSPLGASSTMFVDAGSIASASGDWNRYAKTDTAYLKNGKDMDPSFPTYSGFFLDDKLVSNLENRKYSGEPGRRISYYTPKFEFATGSKAQVGVSYTPDSSNTGADVPSKNSTGVTTRPVVGTQHFRVNKAVKDVFEAGLVLEQNISDGVDIKVALTGEAGKAAGSARLFNGTDTKATNLTPVARYKLKDLRTYNIGSALNVGSFSYAASFGSLGKSLTTVELQKTGQQTNYYTGGVAYKQGPFSASVTYFRANEYKNIVDCVTIGTDYKLAPGLKPYAEVSGFSFKGKPEYFPDLKARKSRGTVAIIGARLSL